jgi:hypothetical protein
VIEVGTFSEGRELSETESTEATTDQHRMMIDDECGAIGGLFGREIEVVGENLPQYLFVRNKPHMT